MKTRYTRTQIQHAVRRAAQELSRSQPDEQSVLQPQKFTYEEAKEVLEESVGKSFTKNEVLSYLQPVTSTMNICVEKVVGLAALTAVSGMVIGAGHFMLSTSPVTEPYTLPEIHRIENFRQHATTEYGDFTHLYDQQVRRDVEFSKLLDLDENISAYMDAQGRLKQVNASLEAVQLSENAKFWKRHFNTGVGYHESYLTSPSQADKIKRTIESVEKHTHDILSKYDVHAVEVKMNWIGKHELVVRHPQRDEVVSVPILRYEGAIWESKIQAGETYACTKNPGQTFKDCLATIAPFRE